MTVQTAEAGSVVQNRALPRQKHSKWLRYADYNHDAVFRDIHVISLWLIICSSFVLSVHVGAYLIVFHCCKRWKESLFTQALLKTDAWCFFERDLVQ